MNSTFRLIRQWLNQFYLRPTAGQRKRHDKDRRYRIKERIKVAIWDVRGIGNKEMELDIDLKQRGINLAVINETKKKLKGTKETENYIMNYSGVPLNRRASCGVAMPVKKWRNRISSYEYISERTVTTKLELDRGHLMIVGVYTPEEGRRDETSRFYEILQQVISKHRKQIILLLPEI
jgi:hypothetical protein